MKLTCIIIDNNDFIYNICIYHNGKLVKNICTSDCINYFCLDGNKAYTIMLKNKYKCICKVIYLIDDYTCIFCINATKSFKLIDKNYFGLPIEKGRLNLWHIQ